MKNANNAGQPRADQNPGGPLEGASSRNIDMAENDEEQEAVVYAGLGVNNQPDAMNPGSEEAADTLLYRYPPLYRHDYCPTRHRRPAQWRGCG